MWEEILRLAAGNGLWALLFCILFIHQLKDSKKREEKYTETIKTLGSRLKIVTEIKTDTAEIKADTKEIKKQTSKKQEKQALKAATVKG